MSPQETPLPARMVAWAADRHGIVALPDLTAAGVTPATIRSWVRSGWLFRIYPAVYSIVHPSLLSEEGRWLAAVRACRANAAVSHAPAGRLLHFLDAKDVHFIEVSVSDRRRHRIPGVKVHRPRSLDPRDITERRKIPVTTPTRTVWDLASVWPEKKVRRVFERVDGRENLDRQRMRQLVRAAPSRRGSALIRDLLANRPLPLETVRSWLEELLFHICSENRLPRPENNADLLGYEVDFVFWDAKFVVEADGGDHWDPAQRDADNLRDIELQRAGFLVRRYSYRAMNREREVAAEVLEILRERLPSLGSAKPRS